MIGFMVYKFNILSLFLLFGLTAFFFSLLLGSLFYLFSINAYDISYDYGAVSFECGFEPSSDITIRPIYSVRYFLLGIVFLVFDLELVLFLPYVLCGASLPFFCYFNLLFLGFFVVITFFLELEARVFLFS
jgi:NADH-ubiquinone oxidoreductase chain 3